MSGKYDDIIGLPHPVSPARPHMSMLERAAQFSPFAALTGYGDAVKETARRTDERIELDDTEKASLNDRLQIAAEHLAEHPIIEFTFFQPDEKKAGGAYRTVTGSLKKIDEIAHLIVLDSGERIPVDAIIGIDGDLFQGTIF